MADIFAYYQSAAFSLLSEDRKKKVRSVLRSISAEGASRRLRSITYADLVLSRDARASKPAAADHFTKAIRAVFRHALDISLITVNPARDLKLLRVDPRALAAVMADLLAITIALKARKIVNVPRDGLGTGLGLLRENRPDIHNLMVSFFRAADGERCPWELV